jgi:hypothetical protein
MIVKENTGLSVKGSISYKLHNGNDIYKEVSRSNVITYAGADLMAQILGGDSSYVPKHIGFMYGTDATAAGLIDPDSLPDSTKRIHRWDNITTDVAAINANILISPLVLKPAVTVDGSDVYEGNMITFAAFTGTQLEYAFPTGGATYAAELTTGMYFYQALLLNRKVVGSETLYTPFARVTLRDPVTSNYNAKPSGFDLSLFWSVTFN